MISASRAIARNNSQIVVLIADISMSAATVVVITMIIALAIVPPG